MALADWLTNLAAHLATNSMGAVGTTIFKVHFPPSLSPASVGVLVTPTQGLSGVYRLDNPRVQIMVRSTDEATAWARANAIYTLLNKPAPFVVGSNPNKTAFLSIEPIQPPFFIGTDAAGASLISCNYQVAIQDVES